MNQKVILKWTVLEKFIGDLVMPTREDTRQKSSRNKQVCLCHSVLIQCRACVQLLLVLD